MTRFELESELVAMDVLRACANSERPAQHIRRPEQLFGMTDASPRQILQTAGKNQDKVVLVLKPRAAGHKLAEP